ncbi:MAG: hypothetical protein J7641_13155 [Cyanobacteria bacterium SID2]|nr:hypothetical protein [Cyanobacteria bacterium SID2]MBP0005735.1 hypothetical protein [Cyanobacteria bacterium SBC]
MLKGREFSLADVIGLEGGSFLKGESPVPKLEQAIAEIHNFIDRSLPDVSGVLQATLYRWVDEDVVRVSQNLDVPLQALLELLESIVDNSQLLYELVRQVDVKWGEMNSERPYFQHPEQAPHPNDEYTHESVRRQLVDLMGCVRSALGRES